MSHKYTTLNTDNDTVQNLQTEQLQYFGYVGHMDKDKTSLYLSSQ